MDRQFNIKDLAQKVDGIIVGDESIMVGGFGPLENAGADEMSFLAKAGPKELLNASDAVAVLVPMEVEESEKTIIRVKDPYLAAAIIQNHMLEKPFVPAGIHTTAVIGDNCSIPEAVSIGAHVVIGKGVVIGSRTTIGPGTVIGDGVTIGEDCGFRANVTIEDKSEIGSRVTIHAGTVIGSDGYGYATDSRGFHVKRPQVGIVKVEDDVEIGANCCIDRATFGITLIKSGTKIDNLVQVAHNVEVGVNNLLVAQVGLAGSTKLGRNVVFGGKASSSGHQKIGDGTMAAGKAAVHGDHPAGSLLAGTPAIDAKQWFKAATLFGKLPDIVRDMRRLKKEVAALAAKLKDNS